MRKYKRSEKTTGNKNKLLEMGVSKCKRPSNSTPLGAALANYTKKTNASYDEEFDKAIRMIIPSWFKPFWVHPLKKPEKPKIRDIRVLKNKNKLLEMVKNGEPQPSKRTVWGMRLYHYTYEKSNSFDIDFFNQILEINQSWLMRKKHGGKRTKVET